MRLATMPPPSGATGGSSTGRPPWALLIALFVLVSLAVYGISRWQPFEPGVPAAAVGPAGDAARGEAVFAAACAACHGTGGAGGGVGPRLVGAELTAAEVAAVVATGRGIMPAGLVQGADAADVAAYVAGISGGDGGVATTPPPVPAPEAAGGRAIVTGPLLSGLTVELDAAAPREWRVWIEGPAGRLDVAGIPAGERSSRTPSVQGGRPLIDGYDRVLVGTDPEAPDLAGSLAPERAQELLVLLVDDPARPGSVSLLDAAGGQVEILREHVRFLAAARDENYLPNVRFHGEHMVNITRGEPLQDVDGNGDPSNPGDGVGLIDGSLAYLPRISTLVGPDVDADDREARDLVALIADQGGRCGRAESVGQAEPAIAAIERADAQLAAVWTRLRTRAEDAAVIELEPR
jgi:cytochrome c551